jgi:hypothetical protein
VDVLGPLASNLANIFRHPLQAALYVLIVGGLLVALSNFVEANSHGPVCGRTAAVTGVGHCDRPKGATKTAGKKPKTGSKPASKEHR